MKKTSKIFNEPTIIVKKKEEDEEEAVRNLINRLNSTSNNGGTVSAKSSHNHENGRASSTKSKSNGVSDKKLTLTWEDINVYKPKSSFYWLKNRLGQHAYKEDKHIVKNVTGLARPYEILAILGASGSGKTTLLNALNMRNRGQLKVEGDVRVNGRLMTSMDEISAVSGYVQQNDLFIGTLRVGEHLTFQAMLRMDRHHSHAERLQRVQDVLVYFNLKKCEFSLIGCPEFDIKGISGGERRRLSFASEILTNPSILFCDEPTSGLDSFMALSIVESMKRIAKNGKTIIFTIHQPSSDLFEKFDRVCFVSEGRMMFLGDRVQAQEFFDSQGYRCPSNYNPAEFYIKTLSISPFAKEVCLEKVNMIANGFESSSFNEGIKTEIEQVNNQLDEYGAQRLSSKDFILYRTSFFTQFFWLMWRNIVAMTRDTASTRILLIQSVCIGIMYGLIFYKIEYNQEGIQNINALVFLSVIYACVIYLFTECKTFPIEIQIFLREHQNGMYKVISYYLSKSLIELPIHIICPFVFVSIFYWMSELTHDFHKYALYVFIIVLSSQTSVSFGHFLSAISPTVTVASGLAGPILGPLMIFSGHLLNNSSTPTYFLWLKYLSWLSYANEAILMTHWKGIENIKCSEYSPRCLSNGEHVLNHLHIDDSEFFYTIYMQIFMIFGWRTLTVLVLLIKSYTN